MDVYGRATRKIIESPHTIARLYNFILCFENDIYPGYVTEKPFEAYLSGAIPLYNGFDKLNFLNPDATINLFQYNSLSDWIDYIKEVDSDASLYKSIYVQPLLIKRPSIEPVVNMSRSFFK